MTKRAAGRMMTIALNQSLRLPLYRQVYDAVRDAILAGTLPPGTRMPATRSFAKDLAVSRNTIIAAFSQLAVEGYLEAKVGAGTVVAPDLPTALPRVAKGVTPVLTARRTPARLPRRSLPVGRPICAACGPAAAPRPFEDCIVEWFPRETWARLLSRHLRRGSRDLVRIGDSAGFAPLRQAVARYLHMSRGVRCEADQVIIVNGSQQGFFLCAEALIDRGDCAWIEDPGYLGARMALLHRQAHLVPIPVDAEGLSLERAERRLRPRLIYVTPSHQYPLGITMSLARRLALLDVARRSRAWVIEDDCDGEFHYDGRPVPALQGLDGDGRVIYVGTFSKVLFPGLRLGYVVVPKILVGRFLALRDAIDRHSPFLEQAALTDFIAEGHFDRHVRRMRALYAERLRVLTQAADEELAGVLEVQKSISGMQVVGWLAPRLTDEGAVVQIAEVAGVSVRPLSRYFLGRSRRPGLVLSYGGLSPELIRSGVTRLARALQSRPVSASTGPAPLLRQAAFS